RHRAEDVADGRAALEPAAREIGRADWKLQVVGQVGRGLAVALALLTVASGALGRLVEILAARDELRRGRWRIANRGRRLGPLVVPAARQGLDERDDGDPLVVR